MHVFSPKRAKQRCWGNADVQGGSGDFGPLLRRGEPLKS